MVGEGIFIKIADICIVVFNYLYFSLSVTFLIVGLFINLFVEIQVIEAGCVITTFIKF